MRVIKATRVRDLAARHPSAASSLTRWLEVATSARWRSLADVRLAFRLADEVKVASGRAVAIRFRGHIT